MSYVADIEAPGLDDITSMAVAGHDAVLPQWHSVTDERALVALAPTRNHHHYHHRGMALGLRERWAAADLSERL